MSEAIWSSPRDRGKSSECDEQSIPQSEGDLWFDETIPRIPALKHCTSPIQSDITILSMDIFPTESFNLELPECNDP
jgi:hypothetical protein